MLHNTDEWTTACGRMAVRENGMSVVIYTNLDDATSSKIASVSTYVRLITVKEHSDFRVLVHPGSIAFLQSASMCHSRARIPCLLINDVGI